MYENIYRFHTTQETEGASEQDHPLGEQIPYCIYWETVRKISNGNEPSFILGIEQFTKPDPLVCTSILNDFESTEGIDESDWWEWNS
mgnify:CR=1 FL=1